MSVVINEFEVVAEAPTVAADADNLRSQSEPALPTTFEIERIERFLQERASRVWAH